MADCASSWVRPTISGTATRRPGPPVRYHTPAATAPSATSTPAPIRVRLRARTVRADWMTVVFWSSPVA